MKPLKIVNFDCQKFESKINLILEKSDATPLLRISFHLGRNCEKQLLQFLLASSTMSTTPHLQMPETALRPLLQDLIAALDAVAETVDGPPDVTVVRRSDIRIFLLAAEQHHSISAIAKQQAVTRQAVHASVKRLEQAGWVKLKPQPGSQRNKLIELTALGQAAQRKLGEQLLTTEAACASAIGATDCGTLKALARRLLDYLRTATPSVNG